MDDIKTISSSEDIFCKLCNLHQLPDSNSTSSKYARSLIAVNSGKIRRRIGLKSHQKLCQEHAKQLLDGDVFGGSSNFECCSPFHIDRNQRPSGLRSIPYSWRSYFPIPMSEESRYRPTQRICWECYATALELITSEKQESADKENEVSFSDEAVESGYVNPRQWASSLVLFPISPTGSQFGSSWSLKNHTFQNLATAEYAMSDENENTYDGQVTRGKNFLTVSSLTAMGKQRNSSRWIANKEKQATVEKDNLKGKSRHVEKFNSHSSQEFSAVEDLQTIRRRKIVRDESFSDGLVNQTELLPLQSNFDTTLEAFEKQDDVPDDRITFGLIARQKALRESRRVMLSEKRIKRLCAQDQGISNESLIDHQEDQDVSSVLSDVLHVILTTEAFFDANLLRKNNNSTFLPIYVGASVIAAVSISLLAVLTLGY